MRRGERDRRVHADDLARKETALKPAPRAGVRAAFIQETDGRAGSGDAGAVVIARVADPSKLLEGRSRALHPGRHAGHSRGERGLAR